MGYAKNSVAIFLTVLFAGATAQDTSAATLSDKAEKRLQRIKLESRSQQWTFSVGPNPALEYSLSELTGLVKPEGWSKGATFRTATHWRALPAKFDWRDQVGELPPIKNQKNCGSCWAFGTVAVLESAVKIRDGISQNFSEQHLVSCNQDGWGCRGGWFAHEYHQSPGAVLSAQFPYVAQDTSCKSGLSYSKKITGWAYVGGDNRVPTTNEIKAAIIEYGPVAATIAATLSMQTYQSGIYNNCTGYTTNHLVNIVGWNDDDGAWIMRNSWGSDWGENGYMRIRYGCNKIGETTSFVRYKPTCQPQPILFTGGDKTIAQGTSTYIGGMPVPGQQYQWTPAISLDDPTVSRPLASPTQTTTYKLTVTNECGSAEKSVVVSVQ